VILLFETKKTQKHLKEMKEKTQIREEAKKYLLEPVKFVEELDYVERKELCRYSLRDHQ
jgi:malonyl CoA-acyl carrier protein transacylase